LVKRLADVADLFNNNYSIRRTFEKYVEKQKLLSVFSVNESLLPKIILSERSIKIIEEFCFVDSDYGAESYDIRIEHFESCFSNNDMKIAMIAMLAHPFIKNTLPQYYSGNAFSNNNHESSNCHYDMELASETDGITDNDTDDDEIHSYNSFKSSSSHSFSPSCSSSASLSPSTASSTWTSSSSSSSSSSSCPFKEKSAPDFSKSEISEVLNSKRSWIEQLAEAVDECCFSITVASARQQNFPLIYVNKAFERTTGI
jgi:hypothetical protein